MGEKSGTLDTVLDQFAEFQNRSLQFTDRVFTALLYPAIVVAISIGVSIFLMTVVLPMLLENLLEAGQTLPWPTRVLKAASDGLTAYGWWMALGVVAAGLLFIAAIRTQAGRRIWHRVLLKLPLIGPMAKKQELSRIALVVSTLLKSGIVFVQACGRGRSECGYCECGAGGGAGWMNRRARRERREGGLCRVGGTLISTDGACRVVRLFSD